VSCWVAVGAGSGGSGGAPPPGTQRCREPCWLRASLTVASVLQQPGHPGAEGRGVAAAAEAGGEPASLPQLSRGKSREAAGAQRPPQGRSTLGVGGREDLGRKGGSKQSPLVGGFTVSCGRGDTPNPSLSQFCCYWGPVARWEGPAAWLCWDGGSGGCLGGR